MVYHKVLFWDLFYFGTCLFINDLPLHVKDIYMLIVTCWQMTQHCTHLSGKDTMQIRSNMQESLMRYPTGVIIIWSSIRSRPGLRRSLPDRNTSCHPYHSISFRVNTDGVKIDQVSEHPRPLGITIDNKLRWDSHINNVCKTVSRRVFLLSKLRYIVDIDTMKLFFNAHIKPSSH